MTYDEYVLKVEKKLESFGDFVYNIDDYPDAFSWLPCEICNRPLGGQRYTAQIGLNKFDTLEICEDCLEFIEYGHLDMFNGEVSLK